MDRFSFDLSIDFNILCRKLIGTSGETRDCRMEFVTRIDLSLMNRWENSLGLNEAEAFSRDVDKLLGFDLTT